MSAPLPPNDDSDRIHLRDAGQHGDEPAEELETAQPRRLAVTAPWAIAAIVAAAAAGFFLGDHHARSPARVVITTTPANTTTAAAPFTNLTTTDNKCSAQIGHQLQLGVEIQNQGNTDVELRRVTPIFPLDGLQAVRTQHGTCGQPAVGEIAGWLIRPGSSVWITTTVKVLSLACPAALPVQFEVAYTSAGRQNRQQLSGFVDLGSVPYTGC